MKGSHSSTILLNFFLFSLWLFVLNGSNVQLEVGASRSGQQCTFREDVGSSIPPKHRKSRKPKEKLVSEWRQGSAIVPLLRPGDLMELKHTQGTHWMIYVGGLQLEYIHTSNKLPASANWTSVQKASLHNTCQRWMIRKNNGLDAQHKRYTSRQVVQRAQAWLGCNRIPFSYSRNNCQHFVNSIRYDIWQSDIGDHRNSCQRNTQPWRQLIQTNFPTIIHNPLYQLITKNKKGKKTISKKKILKIQFYGNMAEDIHSAYSPLVHLVRKKNSYDLKNVKVELQLSQISNKTIGQLLEVVRQMTVNDIKKIKLLKNLSADKKMVVQRVLVLVEWNALVKKLYSKVLSTFPDESDSPINASDGGAVECYRDWDLDYLDKLLTKLIGHFIKNRHTVQVLTTPKNMIQYEII